MSYRSSVYFMVSCKIIHQQLSLLYTCTSGNKNILIINKNILFKG